MFQKRVYFPNNCKNELFRLSSATDNGFYKGERQAIIPSCLSLI